MIMYMFGIYWPKWVNAMSKGNHPRLHASLQCHAWKILRLRRSGIWAVSLARDSSRLPALLKHCYISREHAPFHQRHNLELHFSISNINARKRLNIWAHAEFQGASVGCPQNLLIINIWQRKNRYPSCNIPVIPALVRCVQLIAVLKIEAWDFFEILVLRVFDLDT